MMTLSSSLVVPRTASPRLLVSVRSPEEAVAAIEGGATIIDVKEPLHGPLGMASVETMFTIASTAKGMAGLPVSAALGEVLDWQAQPIPVLPPHVHYAKVGLAGLAREPHWPALWRMVRNEFDVLRGQPLEWVAVAYADHREAGSPDPSSVLEAGIEAGCRVFLIDTWNKSGGRLVDFVSSDELLQFTTRAHDAGVAVALAGRVQPGDLSRLLVCRPDIIAVRGAACSLGQRESSIDRDRVEALVKSLSYSPLTATMISVQINGTETMVPTGSTIAELLVSLGKNPKFLAVERNRDLVPRTKHAECELAAGDQLEIVTLVGGG